MCSGEKVSGMSTVPASSDGRAAAGAPATFTAGGRSGPAASPAFVEREVSLDSGALRLAGTLTLPVGAEAPSPAAAGRADHPDAVGSDPDARAGPVTISRPAEVTHTLRRQPGKPSLPAYRKELRRPVDPDLLTEVVRWTADTLHACVTTS